MRLYKYRNRSNRSYYSGHQKLNLIIKEGSGSKALKWMAIVASISALFIALLTYFYSIESTKISNRAYLVAEKTSMSHLLSLKTLGESPDFGTVVRIKNAGQTPAFHLKIKAAINIYDKEFSSDPDFIDSTDAEIILIPGYIYRHGLKNIREYNSQEIEEIKEGEKFFYAYGELSYTDIFDDRHITKFCFRFEEWSFGGWKFYKKYNEVN